MEFRIQINDLHIYFTSFSKNGVFFLNVVPTVEGKPNNIYFVKIIKTWK